MFCILDLAMHPHLALLNEFRYAIDHMVSTVPASVKEDAEQVYAALVANSSATEPEILEACERIGRAEYPHRKAFHQLMGNLEASTRIQLVLDHVDETVRAFLKEHLDAGVPLDTLTSSAVFETSLTPEQKYQVEDALLDAADHVKDELAKKADPNSAAYKKALSSWEDHAQVVQAKIDELRELANKDPKWKAEILDRADRFAQGFLVTEKDPELEEVEKEIEYWKGVLGDEL